MLRRCLKVKNLLLPVDGLEEKVYKVKILESQLLVNKLKVKVTDLAFDKRVDHQIWHLGRGHLNIILAKKTFKSSKAQGGCKGKGC